MSSEKIEFEAWTLGLMVGVIVRMMIVFMVIIAVAIVTTRLRTHIQLNNLKNKLKSKYKTEAPIVVVGFFHPNCDAGAGGEKVLWQAVKALQHSRQGFGKKDQLAHIQIYSGSSMNKSEMVQSKVIDRFGIQVDKDNVELVNLDAASAKSLEPSNYPVMTVVWQAIAFIRVSCHAVSLQPCDIFVDSMGVGFGYPFVKTLFGCKVYSYTHYPTISNDMYNDVKSGAKQFNNKNTHLKQVKLAYYNILILFYKWCGLYADQVAANSSWTRGHMDSLWSKSEEQIQTIYPPCDTKDFIGRVKSEDNRKNLVISFAQFRPEKRHELQLRIWKQVIEQDGTPSDAHFTMIGTVRGAADEALLAGLKKLSVKLGLEKSVSFEINAPRERLFELFAEAKVAMHTMAFEHFGIALVELMSSGIITVAHRSAGPLEDIIGAAPQDVGYLADSEDSYALLVGRSLRGFDDPTHRALRTRAKEWVVDQFGLEAFDTKFINQLAKLA